MKFDEQFFQSLLSAAFTIQEYNDRALARCAPACRAEHTELLNSVPTINTQHVEAVERKEVDEDKAVESDEAGNLSERRTDGTAANVYIELLKTIEVAEKERKADEKGVDSNDPERTDRLAKHTIDDVFLNSLRIVEADESERKTAAEKSSPTKQEEKQPAEQQNDEQAEHQVSEARQQRSLCDIESLATEVCDSQIDDHFIRVTLEQVLQATRATAAAIALGRQGKLTCRDAVGESSSQVAAMIDTGSCFTNLCASLGTIQFCTNTMLDPRLDAQACQKLGARAVLVMPFFHEEQLLGLIATFSRRPYAFGIREVRTLQELIEKFAASLQISVESKRS